MCDMYEMRDKIQELMDLDYRNFVIALARIETGIENQAILEDAYDEWVDADIPLINDYFYDLT